MKGSLALVYTFLTHALFFSTCLSETDPSGRRFGHHKRIRSPPIHGTPFGSQYPSSSASSAHEVISTISSSLTGPSSVGTVNSQASSPITASASTLTASSSVASTASSVAPTQTIDPTTAQEIQHIHERRLSAIVGSLRNASIIPSWLSSLGPDGKWPDSEVDYTTGCPARRANWPAQEHWQRLVVMAAAWHGGLEGDEPFVQNPEVHNAISRAMDFWFSNDFTNPACLDSGGTDRCPCGTPGFWNTNWFSNIILIPELSGETCLLLNDTLTPTQLGNCTKLTGRSYGTFDHNINGVGFLTGANTLDVAKIGIDQALLTTNVSMLTDAYRRVHNEVVIQNAVKADGIRPDGSFGQHGGIIYNGNYGKDYTTDVLDLEVEAGGTQFAANANSQNAFATLFDGDSWMIFRNSLTGVNHWDFSVLNRFISFPVIDNQATGSIKINLTEVKELGEQWNNDILVNFADSWSKPSRNANAARLKGNRMFYANDYMVHRGNNYVTTLRMYSTRTKNSECTNSQNPFGFHLADGVVYTYLAGNEYEDIAAAWDWNLIPGTTVDYGATPLTCDHSQFTGIENFVGGSSNGRIGVAAMRYTNPFTRTLHWQKTWFFLDDDVQHVMVSGITSTTNASVFSVLDQRLHAGDVEINGLVNESKGRFAQAGAQTLWHGDVGYVFPESNGTFQLQVQVGDKVGNWSAIGTSTRPPPTVDLFAAWIEHQDISAPVAYTAFPGVDSHEFQQKSRSLRLQTIRNDVHISAVYDQAHNTVMAVFWDSNGGSIEFTPSSFGAAPVTITTSGNSALIYDIASGNITVSDPSQQLVSVQVTLSADHGSLPPKWGRDRCKDLIFTLPTGGLAGSSLTNNVGD